MNTEILKTIGLTDNEIKIYLYLLRTGAKTAYTIAKDTGIYRVHVYDKIDQLIEKGLVASIVTGAKKQFSATRPEKLWQYMEEKKHQLAQQEKALQNLMPELEDLTTLPREDTIVEVFKGREGIKYFLKDVTTATKEVCVTGIDDSKYNEALPVFMKQYFRDLKNNKIKERIITVKKKGVFLFPKTDAPTTEYRFLESNEFNPVNTFIYDDKVAIITWNTPPTAVLIKNKQLANTYKCHFEILWKTASLSP